MLSLRPRCCTTPGAALVWLASFSLLYGTGLLLTRLWPALEGHESAVLLVALGAACLFNAARNGTYHCALTGPLFVVLAAVVVLDGLGLLEVPGALVWAVALGGTGAALLLECRFAARRRRVLPRL